MIVIRQHGAWSTVRGISIREAKAIWEPDLAPLTPGHRFNRAFKEKRWDGRVRLNQGLEIPSGLVCMVQRLFEQAGHKVQVQQDEDEFQFDPADIADDYLPPTGKFQRLRPHQLAGVHALLAKRCGILQAVTGSGKSIVGLVLARYLWETMGWRTLFITSRKGLARQTTLVFRSFLKGTGITVGQVGDGKREPEENIVVATGASIARAIPYRKKVAKRSVVVDGDDDLVHLLNYEVLIMDEVQHGSAVSWYDVAMASTAQRRYGLSATPEKADPWSDTRVVAATGPVAYVVTPSEMIAAGVAARPIIAMVAAINAVGPPLPKVLIRDKLRPMGYADAYSAGVVKNRALNRAVIRAAEWFYDRKKQVLILCQRLDQHLRLSRMLDHRGLTYLAVRGDSSVEDRAFAKRQMTARTARIVVATMIWSEGEDIDNVDAMVLAEGAKASTATIQRVGRGMRQGGRDLYVVDFAPTCHPTLLDHAIARTKTYESQGYEVRIVENWPKTDGKNPDDLLPFAV